MSMEHDIDVEIRRANEQIQVENFELETTQPMVTPIPVQNNIPAVLATPTPVTVTPAPTQLVADAAQQVIQQLNGTVIGTMTTSKFFKNTMLNSNAN